MKSRRWVSKGLEDLTTVDPKFWRDCVLPNLSLGELKSLASQMDGRREKAKSEAQNCGTIAKLLRKEVKRVSAVAKAAKIKSNGHVPAKGN